MDYRIVNNRTYVALAFIANENDANKCYRYEIKGDM